MIRLISFVKTQTQIIPWIFPVKIDFLTRKSPENRVEFCVLTGKKSNKFICICVLTRKIQQIELNFVFWQVKSNKFIYICVLTGKIQQIDLNFCFDMKVQINLFEFVFWQRKSIWSIFTGYLLYFFKSNLLFDRKSSENWVEFCVLTDKIK